MRAVSCALAFILLTVGPPIFRKSLSVVLIVDTTNSITAGLGPLRVSDLRPQWDDVIEKTLTETAPRLDASDEIRIASIAGDTRISPPLQPTPQQLVSGYRGVAAYGSPSRLWDGLFGSARILAGTASTTKTAGVILITDGFSSGNIRGSDEAVTAARQSHVAISVVQILRGKGASARSVADAVSPVLKSLAAENQGTYAACGFDARCISSGVAMALEKWR